MEEFSNSLVYVTIALVHFMISHSLASFVYKDSQFADKQQNIAVFLCVVAIFSLAISRLIDNYLVSRGILIGGILLLVTIFIVNWKQMEDEMKLLFMISAFGGLVWFAYNNKYLNKAENEIDKSNDKIDKSDKEIKKNKEINKDKKVEEFEIDF